MDKRLTYLLIGGLFWGSGVTLIDALAPYFLTSVIGTALFYVGTFAMAAVSLIVFARLTGRTRHDMLIPVVIMSLSAMLLDALSFGFVPAIYPAEPAQRVGAAGTLLFFFWSWLFFALLWHRPLNREV